MEKTLMLGRIEDRKRRGQQRWLDGITDSMDMNLGPNEDILKQATINSARIIRQDDRIGSLKAGKYADFVVVDGDPVADLSVMYKVPAHVIKGGTVIR